MKYIFVSGGVVSGLGKGVISASLGLLLKSAGVKVTNVKIDMYLNLDAGTIRPQEHGEVFVTADGLETDQDLGNYERFLNQSLVKSNYVTTGQVYKTVIDRERNFGYHGEDVEAIPHVTDEIISRLRQAGEENYAEVVIVELGGTVGEYQNILFFEANRILKLTNPDPVIHVHVSYLPVIKSLGELKSKPAQQSVRVLQGMGIQPDFLFARSEKPVDDKRKQKLALFCNLHETDVISCPDVGNIYEVPFSLESQQLLEKLSQKLGITISRNFSRELNRWSQVVKSDKSKSRVSIGVVGKYFKTGDYTLKDSYVSVIEALNQAANHLNLEVDYHWIESGDTTLEQDSLTNLQGILVPQGWGSRGVEGKISAINHARTSKIPYLGLCFGMQMAVIEFARHVCGLKEANSTEVNAETRHPVIHIMPDQVEYLNSHQYGGTIRLGSYPCLLSPNSLLSKLYLQHSLDKNVPWYGDAKIRGGQVSPHTVYERHRHRYEFNNQYREQLEKAGLTISGTSPDGTLVEAIEITDHPFFIGTQFHPEYIARPQTPHPIFIGFLEACSQIKK